MSTPLKENVAIIGDITVNKDDDHVQVMVDGETVLFMDLDNAKVLAKALRKASYCEFDEG